MTHLLEPLDLPPDRPPTATLEVHATVVGLVRKLVPHVGCLVAQLVELVVRVGELSAEVVALVQGRVKLLAELLWDVQSISEGISENVGPRRHGGETHLDFSALCAAVRPQCLVVAVQLAGLALPLVARVLLLPQPLL